MTTRTWILTGVVTLLGTWVVGRHIYCATHDLVSLNVENMPVRKVISKLRWQTWEDIRIHKDVEGKVTLRCDHSDLETVMGVINQQLGVRWATIYPLYRTKTQLKRLEPLLTGAATPPLDGWTNYSTRIDFGAVLRALRGETNGPAGDVAGRGGRGGGFGGGFGGPGGGGGELGPNPPVTLDLVGKEIREVTAELRQQSRIRVVPEDGLEGSVTLKLERAHPDQAVAALAKEVNRKWAKYYALEPRGGPPQMSEADRQRMRETADEFNTGEAPDREAMRARMEERMNQPGRAEQVTARLLQGLKTTTAAQRMEQAQRRGRGGPGGPGGPGGGRRPEGARGN